MDSLSNKRVALTGCTGGLGKETARGILRRGGSLIMCDRNKAKAVALAARLRAEFENADITEITLDLSDFSSVKAAAEQLITLKPDIFISNAGAYNIPRTITESQLDNVFQINFAAPYYIIHKLINNNPKTKIIAVGSLAHSYSKSKKTDIDFRYEKSAARVYGNSKRYLMFALHKLFKDCNNLSVVHPGITFTGITDHYPKWLFTIIKHPMKLIFMKPKKAAESILAGITQSTPEGYWIGPSIFEIWGKPKMTRILAYNHTEAGEILNTADEILRKLI